MALGCIDAKDDNEFKDDLGRWVTQGLFSEIALTKKYVRYTLKGYDLETKDKILPSLKKIYLELEDPTEYRIATEYLGGWDHWLRLCNNKIILKEVNQWRKELEVKLRCKAIGAIVEDAVSPSKSAVSSAKWLADRGWAEKRKAGAPSKQEEQHIRREIAEELSDYDDDLKRISNLEIS